ncbi:MAG: hypothetical protein MUD11_05950, partial [Rhodobacteraceae bacterium]|nr:hypothetical protein [Paracoccaceae bacterium]
MQPRLHLALLLMPAVAVIGVLFGGGLVIAVMQSLNGMPVSGQTEPTLAAYRTVLTDPDLGRSFLLSLHIALTSTVLATALGIAAALLLRAGFSGSG